MADFIPAVSMGPAARNPISFLCESSRATARARVERGEWPGDVGDIVIAAADRYEPIVEEAYTKRQAAQQIYRPDALPRQLTLIGDAADAALAKVPGSAKLVSEANTTRAASQPKSERYLVAGLPATGDDRAERDARFREIRAADLARKVEDVRRELLILAARGDDEGYLAHATDPVVGRRDYIINDATMTALERAWLIRAGKLERVEALESAARIVDGLAAASESAIAAFAGREPARSEPQLRLGADGRFVPIAS